MMTKEGEILRDRLVIAMEDLTQAQRFGLLLLEDDGMSNESADQRRRTVRTALEIALVVAYARPFTQQRDKHGNRETPLSDVLDCLDELERQKHDHYVSVVRNQEYAHSDASRYDIHWHEIRIGSAKPFQMPILRNPFAPIELSDVRCLVANCGKLVERLMAKRNSEAP